MLEGESIFVSWDPEQPGITFSAKYGRILIFKRTLDLLGFPECYRFLFSPEDQLFAVQACKISDEGSHTLPPESIREIIGLKVWTSSNLYIEYAVGMRRCPIVLPEQ